MRENRARRKGNIPFTASPAWWMRTDADTVSFSLSLSFFLPLTASVSVRSASALFFSSPVVARPRRCRRRIGSSFVVFLFFFLFFYFIFIFCFSVQVLLCRPSIRLPRITGIDQCLVLRGVFFVCFWFLRDRESLMLRTYQPQRSHQSPSCRSRSSCCKEPIPPCWTIMKSTRTETNQIWANHVWIGDFGETW